MKTYKPTIGIEVHAELKTRTKMFCDCANDPHVGEPNMHTCPICLAHPGSLPVINRQAVAHVLKVGAALGSELAAYTEFDRKNYYYPDIPKGYQISQYLYPLVKGGNLAGVSITRVHLEEDTARSQHESGDGSLIDYNRAGVPLMELVTEPVIHDAETAGNFARELQLLLRTLGVSDANMERGEMRVEANISVSSTDTFGTKVEVKNLNSFRSVEGAIAYEIKRQIEAIEQGEKVIQETRGWDEAKGKTFSQRLKESADDYRYFPDPDLPKLDISYIPELSLSRLVEEMPELPQEKREKYNNLGLTKEQIDIIVADLELARFFETTRLEPTTASPELTRTLANYLTSDVIALTVTGFSITEASPIHYRTLISLVHEGKITSRVAKDLLLRALQGSDPLVLATEQGLLQNNSVEALQAVIDTILAENPTVVEEYKAGKVAAVQYMIGQAMKATKGSANPALLKELFEKALR